MFRPSSSYRAVNCPGSVQLSKGYPDESGPEAEEGTLAHDFARSLLTGVDHAPNISQEMIETVSIYVEYVFQFIVSPDWETHIEEPLNITRVNVWYKGTPDFWAFNVKTGEIVVVDFKYGFKKVPPDSWQLISYAIGITDTLATRFNKPLSMIDSDLNVRLVIIQPRISKQPKEHKMRAIDLRPYANRLSSAFDDCQSKEPLMAAGDWCDDCPANKHCKLLQEKAAEAVFNIGDMLHELTPGELSDEITRLNESAKIIKHRLEALEEEALTKLQQGQSIPGYGVGFGRGTLKWNKPVKDILVLGELLGVNLAKPVDVITPTQAKKLIDESVILNYAEKSKGAARLIKAANTTAKKVFSNVL